MKDEIKNPLVITIAIVMAIYLFAIINYLFIVDPVNETIITSSEWLYCESRDEKLSQALYPYGLGGLSVKDNINGKLENCYCQNIGIEKIVYHKKGDDKYDCFGCDKSFYGNDTISTTTEVMSVCYIKFK
jgi:hypothetical protein